MPVCDLQRADSRADIASLGTACRGFAGVFRLGAPDTLRGLAAEASGDAFAHSRPTLSLDTGPSSRRMRSADARRQLVVTGGLRHGAALLKATEVVESRLDPAALLELPGGLGCAFALHDATQGTLVLGRDGIGVMPLYVSYHADRIAFATELGAFASLTRQAPALDAGALATYLDFGFNGGRHTALRGIERVMPGELIHIGRGLKVRRQRRPSVIGVERANGLGFDKARQVFDTLFEPTVASLIDAHQPSGLLLSGGLDSAVICNALRKASKASREHARRGIRLYPGARRTDRRAAHCRAVRHAAHRNPAEPRGAMAAYSMDDMAHRRADGRPRVAADLTGVRPFRARQRGVYRRGSRRRVRRRRPLPAQGISALSG